MMYRGGGEFWNFWGKIETTTCNFFKYNFVIYLKKLRGRVLFFITDPGSGCALACKGT